MAVLRSPAGCPWDRKQTPESLRPFLLEETYEALDAIDRGDFDSLHGELGDVMFQCVFHAQIAAESGRPDIADAVVSIAQKLIRRHPHVFTPAGQPLSATARRRASAQSSDQVLTQWEALKAREQHAAGATPRILAGVPRALPSLLRAHEIGTRVAAVGFDWPSAPDVMDKIDEEARELREALTQSPARAAEELGDLLFAIANLARKLGVEPEAALRQANEKFSERFAAVEAWFETRGRSIHGAPLDELESAWQDIKKAQGPRTSTTGRAPSRPAPSVRPSRG